MKGIICLFGHYYFKGDTMISQLKNNDFRFIPLKSKSKEPNCKGFYDGNNYTYEEIARINKINYGVLCGYGNLLVIDTDSDYLSEYVLNHALLPRTFTVKTCSGGYHFYFYCEGFEKELILKNSSGEHLGELKWDRHYVVGVGSWAKCKKTGEIKQYKVHEDMPIASIDKTEVLDIFSEFLDNKPILKISNEGSSGVSSIAPLLSYLGEPKVTNGDEYKFTHPIHGSTTGTNLSINIKENYWHCFRCNTGGDVISLVAILEGIITCGERLEGPSYIKTLNVLSNYGLEQKYDAPLTVAQEDVYNDEWRASIFQSIYKGKIYYSKEFKSWVGFNGSKYTADDIHMINARRITVQSLRSYYSPINDKDQAKFDRFVCEAGNLNRLDAMEKLSRHEMALDINKLDNDFNIFNCKNGIYDFSVNEFVPHSDKFLISKMGGVTYDKEAQCPNWEKFINKIFQGDIELISWIQVYLGSCLVNSVTDSVLVSFYGKGANGKSTIIRVMKAILEEYAVNTSNKILVGNKYTSDEMYSLALLKGSRLVLASEIEKGQCMAEGRIKELTSSEELQARHIYGRPFSYRPTFKIILCTNYKLQVKGTDDGIWRRIITVPFNYSFVGAERDNLYFENKLVPELSGIFNWLIEGYNMYKNNNFSLVPAEGTLPEAILEEGRAYKASMDVLTSFVEEYLIETGDKEDYVLLREMFVLFKKEVMHMARDVFYNYFEENYGACKITKRKDKTKKAIFGYKMPKDFDRFASTSLYR